MTKREGKKCTYKNQEKGEGKAEISTTPGEEEIELKKNAGAKPCRVFCKSGAAKPGVRKN